MGTRPPSPRPQPRQLSGDISLSPASCCPHRFRRLLARRHSSRGTGAPISQIPPDSASLTCPAPLAPSCQPGGRVRSTSAQPTGTRHSGQGRAGALVDGAGKSWEGWIPTVETTKPSAPHPPTMSISLVRELTRSETEECGSVLRSDSSCGGCPGAGAAFPAFPPAGNLREERPWRRGAGSRGRDREGLPGCPLPADTEPELCQHPTHSAGTRQQHPGPAPRASWWPGTFGAQQQVPLTTSYGDGRDSVVPTAPTALAAPHTSQPLIPVGAGHRAGLLLATSLSCG